MKEKPSTPAGYRSPAPSGDNLSLAVRDFHTAILNYHAEMLESSPSVTGFVVPSILPTSPLYVAVARIVKLIPSLPPPICRHWRKLLRQSRKQDDAAEDTIETLSMLVSQWLKVIPSTPLVTPDLFGV